MILLDLWRRLFRRKRKRSFITPDAGFIPEIWSRELDDAMRSEMINSMLLDRTYDPTMRRGGDVLRINDITRSTVHAVAGEDLAGVYVDQWAPQTQQQLEDALKANRQAYESFMDKKVKD